MPPEPATICTIGYERRSLDEFLELLRGAPVDTLIDTRHRAGSRKRGFARTALTEALRRIGIRYEHRRDLGPPPHLMEVMRTTGSYSLVAYEEFFEAQDELLSSLTEVAGTTRTVLLCYELDPGVCHRSILAKHVAREAGLRIVHL